MRKSKRVAAAAAYVAVGLAGGLYASHASAQVNAVQTGNWTDPNSWDLGFPPAPGNDAAIGPVDGVTLTINAGDVATAGFVWVGQQPGFTNGLVMNGGSLTSSDPSRNTSVIFGQANTTSRATFVMSGGTINVSIGNPQNNAGAFRDFIIGDTGTTASGTMTGGTINAGDQFIVGIGTNGPTTVGSGTFSITNATINTGGIIDVGFLGGSGTMTIGAGALLQAPSSRFRMGLGDGPATKSNVVMTGGVINVGDAVVIGDAGASTLTMSGGVINSVRGRVLSVNGSNVTTTGNNDFVVGDFNSAGAVATLNISGTSQITVGDRFGLGFTGAGASGVVNQSGGSIQSNGFIVARANGAGTSGVYNMTGGTITQTGNATLPATGGRRNDSDFIVAQGDTSVGVFYQSGGSVSARNIFLGDFDRANATYKISGGSLAVATDLYVGSALAANADVSAYVDPTHITIPGGQAAAVVALFDVVGHNASAITIGRDLLANPADRNRTGIQNQATLKFELGDAAGTTLVQVGSVADLDGAVIDLATFGGFTPTRGEMFNLISAPNFMTNGVTFAAEDASNYHYSLVPGNGGLQILQVIYGAPANLIWNQSGGTWDTNASNAPWTDSATSAPASFFNGDTANFTDAAVGTVNIAPGGVTPAATVISHATGTYTFTGGGILGGSLAKSNAGTAILANGNNSVSSVSVSAGTLQVGDGTTNPALNVGGAVSITGGTLRLGATGTAHPAAVTHNIGGALTLSGSGTLDVNSGVVLNSATTPLSQVRSYLLQARNGGSWTGVGGINSSTVQASPVSLGMAYFSGANPANASLTAVPSMTNTTAIYVRPAQIGDFNGDGVVDRFDIRQFNTRGSFNDGGTNHDWADGDLNNDGVVDRFDIRAFNTAGNFNNGVTFAAQSAAQPATLTTKASAAPAVAPINSPTTVGITGDGKPDLVYDPSTGDVIFKYDGFVPPAASPLVEMEIDSAKGSLRPNNASQTVAGSLTTSADGKLIDFANLGPTAIADGVDLGQIFPTNSNALALTTGDISVSLFLYHDQTGSSYFADVVGGTAGVPEPTSLALLGVAAAGLLGRRRKRQRGRSIC